MHVHNTLENKLNDLHMIVKNKEGQQQETELDKQIIEELIEE